MISTIMIDSNVGYAIGEKKKERRLAHVCVFVYLLRLDDNYMYIFMFTDMCPCPALGEKARVN